MSKDIKIKFVPKKDNNSLNSLKVDNTTESIMNYSSQLMKISLWLKTFTESKRAQYKIDKQYTISYKSNFPYSESNFKIYDNINNNYENEIIKKELNEKIKQLNKEINAKNIIIDILSVENLELKEKLKKIEILNINIKEDKEFYSKEEFLRLKRNCFSKEKKIEELNEKLKKIERLLKVEMETTVEEKIQDYEYEIEKLKQQIENLNNLVQFYSQKKEIIEKYLEHENEINILKRENEKYIKEIKKLNEKYKNEINNLKRENENLTTENNKIKNENYELKIKLERNNNIININNNMISTQELDNLKKELEKLKKLYSIILNLDSKTLKRSCFEIKSQEENDEEYDNGKMLTFAKIQAELTDAFVEFPKFYEIIQRSRETEFYYNTLCLKVKTLLESNNKKTENELRRFFSSLP